MEGTYRITKTGIKQLVLYESKKRLTAILFLFSAVIIFSIIKSNNQPDATLDIVIKSVLLISCFIIISIFYYRFFTAIYAGYTVEILYNSIRKAIELTDVKTSGGIIKRVLTMWQNLHPNTMVFIYYKDIVTIKPHPLGFLIISNKPNEQILIPSGIESFEAVKEFIIDKAKNS